MHHAQGKTEHQTSTARHVHGYTEFSGYSHQQLYDMLFASGPGTIREAAAAWDSTASMLADQAHELKRRLISFSDMWQGAAADEYKTMITDLASGLERVSAGAYAMKNVVSSAAESVEKARAQMPWPQAVPDLDPQVVAVATTPAPAQLAADPAGQQQYAMQQQQAQQAVLAHQSQVGAAQASHAQAVAVMQTLSAEYGSTEDSIPASLVSVAPSAATGPDGGGVPGAIDSNDPAGLVALPPPGGAPVDATGLPGTVPVGMPGSASVPESPLFGHMFTAGLAAASAAAAGRFGSVMPRLPSFLNPKKPPKAKAKAKADAAAAHAVKMPVGGGMGGGGGGGLGGLGGGATPAAATAYPGLLTNAGSVAGGAAGAVAGQVAGAAGASSSSGMMPMMPMGGMAGAGGGDLGGKRIPPWLVETEDVWGESSAVSPSVIGEDS